jgi:flavin-binding protein dodecin
MRCNAPLSVLENHGGTMSVAKVTEITAESRNSFDEAIREGISRASKTLHNIQNVWIKEQQVVIKDNKPESYRVGMKVTFILKD